jgi:2-polyprenyl-6-methoxyphenol hydroxylase-like FAD-dependent oxidoreductase
MFLRRTGIEPVIYEGREGGRDEAGSFLGLAPNGRDVLATRWYRGRVCLAGDAAHAVGPHSGQGGSLALEDAIVLAKCLRDAPEVEAAFAAYQRIRKERAEHVAHQTRRIGNRKAAPGPIGRAFRDRVLPVFLRQGVKTFEPIYAHHIEWQA